MTYLLSGLQAREAAFKAASSAVIITTEKVAVVLRGEEIGVGTQSGLFAGEEVGGWIVEAKVEGTCNWSKDRRGLSVVKFLDGGKAGSHGSSGYVWW